MKKEKRKKKLRVLLTGGGTGGHVYPMLSIFDILKSKWEIEDVLYVGAKGKAEESIVPRYGIPLRFVHCAPATGLSPGKLMRSIFRNAVGTVQALGILLRFRPHLVLAAGGYVSAPVAFAAFLLRPFLGCRLAIEEQNVMPGLMNKVASLFAQVVMVSFPETPYYIWNNRCVYTGYPVREDFLNRIDPDEARQKLNIEKGRDLVLVYGGSMGARAINRLMTTVASRLAGSDRRITVIHSCGLSQNTYHAWQDTVNRLKGGVLPEGTVFNSTETGIRAETPNRRLIYLLEPYLFNMADVLAAAHLVICRAGAGTLAEITALGKAAIVIPKRKLPGDHQEHNAISLAEEGGCEVVFEQSGENDVDYVDPDEFLSVYEKTINNPQYLKQLAQHSAACFNRRFREKILLVMVHLLEGQSIEFESAIVEPKRIHIQKQVDALVKFLLDAPSDSLYRRFYRIKMEEYLESDNWMTVNNGIKLIGGLQCIEKLAVLLSLFKTGNGFMRRNVLQAFSDMEAYDPTMDETILSAMNDSYFEVRAKALQVAEKYAPYIRNNRKIVEAILKLAIKRIQHFDVRVAGVRALALFVELEEYFRIVAPLRFARNVRLRRAILDGIRLALEMGRIKNDQKETVRQFINEFLITTSDFRPSFSIRQSYVDLFKELSDVD